MKTSLLTSLLLFLSLAAEAATVTLAWDAETDPNVVGYNVYQGNASKNYTNMFHAGNVTSLTISNLTPGATYYFAATAYTLAGLESQFSNEAVYNAPTNTGSPPVFTIQPQSSTNNYGKAITLTGNAGASALYQWRRSGTNIPGATSTSLTFTFLTWTNNGTYTLQASNTLGVAVSSPATITVTPPVVTNVRVTGP